MLGLKTDDAFVGNKGAPLEQDAATTEEDGGCQGENGQPTTEQAGLKPTPNALAASCAAYDDINVIAATGCETGQPIPLR